MKAKSAFIKAILLPAVLLAGCVNDPDYSPGGQKTDDNPAAVPAMGSYESLSVGIKEVSGLCFNKDHSALIAVSDKGEVYSLAFDGSAQSIFKRSCDMEGVAIDPSGNLYIAVEQEQKVLKLAAPDYSTCSELFTVEEAVNGKYENQGIEGITYYKGNTLLIGAQQDASLWRYGLDAKLLSSLKLTGIHKGIEEIAGLYYDESSDWLWVSDSASKHIFIFTPSGDKLIASYDISFIDNGEGICVDRARSCVWIASDEKKPKLYKISFKF